MNAVAQLEIVDPQLPARASPTALLAEIIRGGAALEVVREMKATIEWDEARHARKDFDRAIAAAKAEIPVIHKNRVGHNDKRYADIAAIASVVDPILAQHGLSYRYRTTQDDKIIRVTCVLSHEAGHYEENTLASAPDPSGNKTAIHAMGSALTYLQRYSLVQALGIAVAEDDDGRAAGTGATITDEQVAELSQLLTDTGSNLTLFLKTIKLESLTQIRADKFEDAKKLITDTAAKRAARTGAAS